MYYTGTVHHNSSVENGQWTDLIAKKKKMDSLYAIREGIKSHCDLPVFILLVKEFRN